MGSDPIWDETVNNHATVKLVKRLLKITRDFQPTESPPTIQGPGARAKYIIKYMNAKIDTADTDLLTHHLLQAANQNINTAVQHIERFSSDGYKNITHLTNSLTHLENAMPHVLAWPSSLNDESKVLNVIASIRERNESHLIRLKAEVDSTEVALQHAKQGFVDTNSALDSLENKIKDESSRLDTVVSEFQSSSHQQVNDQSTRFADKMEEYSEAVVVESNRAREKLQKQMDLARHDLTGLEKSNIERFDALFKELEDTRDKALNILEVIGNTGITGNYKLSAKEEKKTADNLRNSAFACFAIMATVVVIASVSTESFTWSGSLFRMFTAFAFLVPGTYLMRESSKHRNIAIQNSKIELELASLEPYIATLPENDKYDIKKALIQEYFNSGSPKVSAPLSPAAINPLQRIAEEVVDQSSS